LTEKHSLNNLSIETQIPFPDYPKRKYTFTEKWRCRGSPGLIASEIHAELGLKLL
jgi:hypothetical protein